MAEKKYDLIVQNRHAKCYNRNHSWYKERMETKYLKQLKPGEKMNSYNAKDWLFLRRGLDDFRDGLPPIGNSHVDKKMTTTLQKDFFRISEIKKPAALKRLNKYRTYLSKMSPQQQQQRNYITHVEQSLLRHPLALYPHLEESVAPEQRQLLLHFLRLWRINRDVKEMRKKVFENIVDILDPQFSCLELQDDEMGILRMMGVEETPRWNQMSLAPAEEEKPKLDQSVGTESTVRNLYRWLPLKENVRDNKKSKEKEKMWPSSQSEEEHIKQVTQEFCEWVADLGGDSNNIEESTVTSLFASGYDTKPSLSVPIHIVDLASIPHELRLSAIVPPPAPPEKAIPLEDKPTKKMTGDVKETFIKFRYGAWYLKPSTWKKMDYYELLEDPKQLKEHEMSTAKKKCHELTEELSTVHASKAFDEFIMKKNTRKPEFLAEIAEIQRKAAQDEELRTEAEALAKQKKYMSKSDSH